ncbi:MAG: recombinase family protein [Chitinophagaceae bacterium]
MNALYCRVSTLDQKTDRQTVNEKDYGTVIEDKCSGAVPFFEREGGKEIKKLIDKGILTSLSALSLDRMGRDLRDILNTIYFFNEKKIAIHFISQGLKTLDENGKENSISKMMISILGTVAEMERTQIRERQLEGIRIAKMKGNIYKGRVTGSKENVLDFLSKEKNKQALNYLKKGYKCKDVAKITDLHINTITKIKKLGLNAA